MQDDAHHYLRMLPAPKAAAGVAVHRNTNARTGSSKLQFSDAPMLDETVLQELLYRVAREKRSSLV